MTKGESDKVKRYIRPTFFFFSIVSVRSWKTGLRFLHSFLFLCFCHDSPVPLFVFINQNIYLSLRPFYALINHLRYCHPATAFLTTAVQRPQCKTAYDVLDTIYRERRTWLAIAKHPTIPSGYFPRPHKQGMSAFSIFQPSERRLQSCFSFLSYFHTI